MESDNGSNPNFKTTKSVSQQKYYTASDTKQLQEKSYVWFVSKDAAKDFDKRINKSNCLDS